MLSKISGASARIVLALLLVTGGVLADELPILPAPERIQGLPLPNGFSESNSGSLIETTPQQMNRDALIELGGIKTRGAPVLDLIRIDLEQLRVLTFDASGKFAGLAPTPARLGPRRLQFKGESLDLVWLSQAFEPVYGLTHVTMRAPRGRGYARFAVGPGYIVGTLITDKGTYRILTIDQNIQGVFPLSSDASGPPARYRRLAGSANSAIALAEKRHTLMERIADIQPDSAFDSERGRSFELMGGKIGRLPELTEAGVMTVLEQFADLVYLPEGFAMEVTRTQNHSAGGLIEFRQLVNGIEVWGAHRIATDPSGAITRISTQFADPAWASSRPVMSEAEALEFAKQAIHAETGAMPRSIELDRPAKLMYRIEPPEPKLVPRYEFLLQVQPSGRSFGMYVDAHHGDALFIRPVN